MTYILKDKAVTKTYTEYYKGKERKYEGYHAQYTKNSSQIREVDIRTLNIKRRKVKLDICHQEVQIEM